MAVLASRKIAHRWLSATLLQRIGSVTVATAIRHHPIIVFIASNALLNKRRLRLLLL